jgi:hypothetical protein
MEPEGSLPYSQVPATCPYPEPTPSSPTPPSHFLNIHLNILLPSTSGPPQRPLSLRFTHQHPVTLKKEPSRLLLQDTRGKLPKYPTSCEYQISKSNTGDQVASNIMCSSLHTDNTRYFSPCCDRVTRFSLDQHTDRTRKVIQTCFQSLM